MWNHRPGFGLVAILLLLTHSTTASLSCSLNGVVKGGECQCDPGWVGKACEQLALAPVPASPSRPLSGAVWPPPNTNMSSWGGNVLCTSATCHLYVSEFVDHCGLASWQSNSRIVRVAAASTGNTTAPAFSSPEDVVMPPFAHNANPVFLPGSLGGVAVFHVGAGTSSGLLKCTNGTTPPKSGVRASTTCKAEKEPIPLSSSIPLPYSSSPSGEWLFRNQTCVGAKGKGLGGCPHFSNAAALILPNGTTLLVHSGCPGNQGHGFNLAVAPEWHGPYRPMAGLGPGGDNAWFTPAFALAPNHSCTDPFLWMNPRGEFHALFHCHYHGEPLPGEQGDLGGHAFSPDGVTWTVSPFVPFNETVQLQDGTAVTYSARQRPHLALRGDGVPGASPSGSPWGLVTGVKVFTKDSHAQLPWMANCNGPMDPGCDLSITHFQPVANRFERG